MPDPDDWREETFNDTAQVQWRTPSTQLRVVVVPIDFSAPSRCALAWALEYAQLIPCELHTVHVIDRHWRRSDLSADTSGLQRELAEVHATAAAEMARLVDDARAKVGALHEHVTIGAPAEEILALAQDLAAALIVVGSHGHSALERWLVGSVAEKVVRIATCPVVVVKPPADDRTTE